ncbi:hypothetical protein C4587_01795 [Candidatus Parcubacteria bacterium]|nr:MAG: hypothetical protein C4587_01795 [Candidatus Parcubacteria bacterium]
MERDGDEQITQILGEFGGSENEKEILLKVYKVLPGRGKMGWLFDIVPAELPVMNRLRDEPSYGSGDYAIRVLVNNVLKKILRFTIIAPAPKADAERPNDLTAVLRAMSENQARMFEQLQSVMTKQGSGLSNMTETLTLMKTMREVFAPPQGAGGFKETVETIAMLKDLLPESGGGGSNIWDVAKSLLSSPLVGNLAEAVAAARANTPMPQRLPPGHQLPPGTVIPQQSQFQQPEIQPMGATSTIQEHVIRQQIVMLVGKAKQNKDPDLYADLILDNVPPEVIVQQLLQPDSLERVFQMVPEARNFQDWFQELQKSLAESINELYPSAPVEPQSPFPPDHSDPNTSVHTSIEGEAEQGQDQPQEQ